MSELLDATFQSRSDVQAREFEGEIVIVDLSGGRYYALDSVGARAWTMLVRGCSPREAARLLEEEYDVTLDRLEADVLRLVRDLLAAGLMVRR